MPNNLPLISLCEVQQCPHNAKFLADGVVRSPVQILVSVGGFPIDLAGDTIVGSQKCLTWGGCCLLLLALW